MSEEPDPVETFRERRDRIRAEMGGTRPDRAPARAAASARCASTSTALLDAGSFEEVGTFVHSARPEDADEHAGRRQDRRPRHDRPAARSRWPATTSPSSAAPPRRWARKRLARLFGHAERSGHPIVYFGATGGARIPDTLGSAGFSEVPLERRPLPPHTGASRSPPSSSATASAARRSSAPRAPTSSCSCAAPAWRSRRRWWSRSPPARTVDQDALGGVDVHARTTGQIDLIADDARGGLRARAPLPGAAAGQRARQRAPRAARRAADSSPTPQLAELVPRRRSRAYDMTRVLRRVLDDDTLLELAPAYGRGLICGSAASTATASA